MYVHTVIYCKICVYFTIHDHSRYLFLFRLSTLLHMVQEKNLCRRGTFTVNSSWTSFTPLFGTPIEVPSSVSFLKTNFTIGHHFSL